MTNRQRTHSYECWSWGPAHYECAVGQIERLRAENEALRAEVERLKSMTAVTMGVGSGDGNLFVHGDYDSIRAAQAIVLELDALRAEVDTLREALAGLITWIPSADTYRRLGFDPAAPMRALERARAALGREGE